MKAIVIYDTKFGNTEKIANALVSGIEEHEITRVVYSNSD